MNIPGKSRVLSHSGKPHLDQPGRQRLKQNSFWHKVSCHRIQCRSLCYCAAWLMCAFPELLNNTKHWLNGAFDCASQFLCLVFCALCMSWQQFFVLKTTRNKNEMLWTNLKGTFSLSFFSAGTNKKQFEAPVEVSQRNYLCWIRSLQQRTLKSRFPCRQKNPKKLYTPCSCSGFLKWMRSACLQKCCSWQNKGDKETKESSNIWEIPFNFLTTQLSQHVQRAMKLSPSIRNETALDSWVPKAKWGDLAL